jgi:hypothetical protein
MIRLRDRWPDRLTAGLPSRKYQPTSRACSVVPAHLPRLESRPQPPSLRDRVTTILAGIHIDLAEASSWDPVDSAYSTLRLDDSHIDELNPLSHSPSRSESV